MRVFAGIVIGLLFFAGMLYATFSESQVSCSVCMRFGGGQACRTVSAADRDHAIAMATSGACAELSGGVTQGIQCQQTPPMSLSCDE